MDKVFFTPHVEVLYDIAGIILKVMSCDLLFAANCHKIFKKIKGKIFSINLLIKFMDLGSICHV